MTSFFKVWSGLFSDLVPSKGLPLNPYRSIIATSRLPFRTRPRRRGVDDPPWV